MKIPMPQVMVAPNGAHTKRRDHPKLPLALEEVGDTIADCVKEGVEAYHLHVHGVNGEHSLDTGKFRALLDYVEDRFPGKLFQVTTESVGLYDWESQYRLVEDLKPWSAALVLQDMLAGQGSDEGEGRLKDFLEWSQSQGVLIQHLLRSPGEIGWLMDLIERKIVPREGLCLQFLSGKTTMTGGGSMADFEGFMTCLDEAKEQWGRGEEDFLSDWMMGVCGKEETVILQAALSRGGKVRIGFENNIWNRDGSVASTNAERLRDIFGK